MSPAISYLVAYSSLAGSAEKKNSEDLSQLHAYVLGSALYPAAFDPIKAQKL